MLVLLVRSFIKLVTSNEIYYSSQSVKIFMTTNFSFIADSMYLQLSQMPTKVQEKKEINKRWIVVR